MSVNITQTQKFCVIVRRHTIGTSAAVQKGTKALHLIISKDDKLFVCEQMILRSSYKIK